MKNLALLLILFTAIGCSAQTTISDLNNFEKQSWQDLNENVIKMIGKDWMLIAAGNLEDYNMMTASWGTLGWLWEKPVSTIYVRPQRHTHTYTESEEYYSICFFNDPDKEVLRLMGTVSGRDFDKMNYEKLSPIETPNGSIAFKEAYIVIECKKLYSMAFKEDEFTNTNTMNNIYPKKDFHTAYIGEIVGVWRKK
ncbi:MAG: flavin reductase [Bacteroidales bacterium]|nr:flavin reductase [Bacteroidales bacterium]